MVWCKVKPVPGGCRGDGGGPVDEHGGGHEHRLDVRVGSTGYAVPQCSEQHPDDGAKTA